ncbi:MAG: DNA translocase FtsK [Fimbriimonadaceae bacterium]|jgi:S-DNA-T family DNA segregation ATPase FtsK/SpoIIIE|nr:DNA translocase FtsK [Fimbriimonadaceae bacterium]
MPKEGPRLKDSQDETRVPVRRSRAAVTPERPHHLPDVVGIITIATGVILLAVLALGNGGLLGNSLVNFFQILFGKGAWVVGALLLFAGWAILAGKSVVGVSRVAWGSALIFIGALALFARSSPSGDFFDPAVITGSGGYLGAIAGWALTSLLGVVTPVGIAALLLVGIVLCLDQPVREWMASLKRQAQRPVAAIRDTAGKIREKTNKHSTQGLATEADADLRRKAAVKVLENGHRSPLGDSDDDDEALPDSQSTAPAGKVKKPFTLSPATQSSQQTVSLDTTVSEPKEGYSLPPLNLLVEPQARAKRDPKEVQRNIATLENTLEQFGIEANVVEVANGPTITRYEVQLGPGIRVGRITALADNIAMNLAASHVRVEAPIPGKNAIGVEVPTGTRAMVSLREMVESLEFHDKSQKLTIALGKDVSGTCKYTDLTRMPHLLVGGATNSGKSICLSALVMSLILKMTPKELRLVMIDPKRVEMAFFEGLPHLMCPVVKDVKEAPGVLRAVVREMDRRYDRFSEAGVRNIDGWNQKASFQDKLPYIVVIIDELADLMIQAAAEVETSICRLAQLARATGIHLVIATQRPSVDVITGTIKNNISSRIAFAVSSQIDSRTILDQAGADKLIGKGDMLFLPIDALKPVRIQGCYISEKEIEDVCDFWREQEKPHYVLNPVQIAVEEREAEMREQEDDPFWEDAVRFVVERGEASTSMLQRKFSIGFQRASRLLDMMEERGIVGRRDGPRPRQVTMDPIQMEQLFGRRDYMAPMDPSEYIDDQDER